MAARTPYCNEHCERCSAIGTCVRTATEELGKRPEFERVFRRTRHFCCPRCGQKWERVDNVYESFVIGTILKLGKISR